MSNFAYGWCECSHSVFSFKFTYTKTEQCSDRLFSLDVICSILKLRSHLFTLLHPKELSSMLSHVKLWNEHVCEIWITQNISEFIFHHVMCFKSCMMPLLLPLALVLSALVFFFFTIPISDKSLFASCQIHIATDCPFLTVLREAATGSQACCPGWKSACFLQPIGPSSAPVRMFVEH